ncbi:MAG: single-stranded-DNA-specific exonuclease RecJ [Blastocatellales bacterium]
MQSSPVMRGITGARWNLRQADYSQVESLTAATGLPEVVIRCLVNRGLSEPAGIQSFLEPDFHTNLHPPGMLRDMALAVERLKRAIAERQRILVVTDFDVDGTTSSVILSQTLRLLGADGNVECYIPDRFTEGYGLSTSIVEKAAADGFSLILTADIGIKSHREAQLARSLGIDLIICDHHLPDGEDVPAEAYAVLCPKGSSGEGYPNKHLAACGVSLKLAEALLAEHPKRNAIIESLAKLTAIGTVADMVDLAEAENRAIVAHGLRALAQRSSNPGLRALLKLAQVGDPVTTYDIGFKIGPRINAAGRIAHAGSVLRLFEAPTDEEASELALKLDELNSERQQIQNSLFEQLKKQVEARESLENVMVFHGSDRDGFHRGVVGIACSKIVELTGRPTFIASVDEEGIAHGSARSISGFHLVEALDSISDILVKYGGHPMAAGFTLPAEKMDEMRWRLDRYAGEILTAEDLGRSLTADAELPLSDLTIALIRELQRLEPHGIGNPSPLFLLRDLPVARIVVLKERHLKLQLASDRGTVDALWWNAVDNREALEAAGRVSLLARPEINSWNGRQSAQLKIVDVSLE